MSVDRFWVVRSAGWVARLSGGQEGFDAETTNPTGRRARCGHHGRSQLPELQHNPSPPTKAGLNYFWVESFAPRCSVQKADASDAPQHLHTMRRALDMRREITPCAVPEVASMHPHEAVRHVIHAPPKSNEHGQAGFAPVEPRQALRSETIPALAGGRGLFTPGQAPISLARR